MPEFTTDFRRQQFLMRTSDKVFLPQKCQTPPVSFSYVSFVTFAESRRMIYLFSGMGANERIFRRLDLRVADQFKKRYQEERQT